jgi:hypothetical protein
MAPENASVVPAEVMTGIRHRAREGGRPLDRDWRSGWERIFGQDLGGVLLHFGNDELLDALGARGACWRNHVFLHSNHCDQATILHEVTHAAQWLRFGDRGSRPAGSISAADDPCEQEADRFARPMTGARGPNAIGVTQPCSAEFLLAPSGRLIVDCRMIGHASPRWSNAPTEQERVRRNEVLSVNRADAVAQYFESELRSNLKGRDLEFRYNQTSPDDSSLPDNTVLVGSTGRGQRDSILLARGDKFNDDREYRRVDLDVRIARKTEEWIPTVVKRKLGIPTKTKFWYVSTALTTGVAVGPAAAFVIVKLQNQYRQTAIGHVVAAGIGAGARLTKDTFSLADKVLSASVTFSDDTSFYTDKEVGFADFHPIFIRYTTASVAVFGGYNASWITFYGMGSGAASLYVGGLSLGGDLGLTGMVVEGFMWLHEVPDDYIIDTVDQTNWDPVVSEWTTRQSKSVYFDDGSADISKERGNISRFAADVARDVRTN